MRTMISVRCLRMRRPLLMYMHDLTGILTRVNRAFERVTGYHREEAIGTSFFDLVREDAREAARQRVFEHLGGSGTAFTVSGSDR